MQCGSEALDFGSVSKHPSERLSIQFDFFPNLADFWQPGNFYRIGEIVRPLIPNGFVEQASADGTSGNREPRWSKSDGGLTSDGSIQWQSIPATNQGIDIITNASANPASGIGVPISPVWEAAIATIVIDGGSDGADYPLECQVTTQRGSVIVGVIDVHVRKQRNDEC